MTRKEKSAKVAKVMREFKAGVLKGSDDKPITNKKQAIAIALSEAGMSRGGKSDEYWDNYFTVMIGEAEEPEEEAMDESAGEKRCKAYMATVKASKRKKD